MISTQPEMKRLYSTIRDGSTLIQTASAYHNTKCMLVNEWWYEFPNGFWWKFSCRNKIILVQSVLWESFSHLLGIHFIDCINIIQLETKLLDRLDSESNYLSDGVLNMLSWRTYKIIWLINGLWWIWYQNSNQPQKLMIS